MKTIRLLVSALFIFGIMAGIVLTSHAQMHKKTTKLVFTEDVQVPGTVLPPGTYVFKLVDSLANRNIISISNEAGDHVFALLIAIPTNRRTVTGDTEVEYWETPKGAPLALRSWFYPGDNYGQEFAYPKNIAVKIAQEEQVPVPAIAETVAPKAVESPVPAPVISELEKTPVEMVAPPPPAVVLAQEKPSEELPQTASPLPLIGLLSLAFVGTGIVMRAFRLHRNS